MKKSGKKGKRERLKLIISFVYKFGEKISDNYTAACAAQAAFFILLSIVPIISLILAVTTYLPLTQQDVLHLMMQFIPDDLIGYVQDIIADLYSRAGKTVISVSAIAMLWSASKGIAALMDGFNSMYQLRQDNSNWLVSRCIAIVYTILFILLFVIAMCGYVTVSHYYQEYIKGAFEIESAVRKVLLLIRYVIGWLLFYAFLLMMYVILPGGFGLPIGKEEKVNLGVRIRQQMPGAAFAAVAWLVISQVVVIYIDYFPSLSLMYGSLAGIVIAMLWLYFCMYSIFIGAVINYLLSEGYLTRVKKMLK
ncbi:MAG: YihY/virulence factor BrkB family protein [Lachnospiraceae bacterium]|nr:YihY/virulence factor BrkB family protein [Lachnospiraceae bacterium]